MLQIFKELGEKLKQVKTKGSTTQNIMFLGSSKFLIAVGGFLLTPILSRIYGPEAYGILATYNAYVTIIAAVATLRLPIAYVLTDTDDEFHKLLTFSLITTLFISVLCIPVFSMNLFGFENLDKLGWVKNIVFLGVLLTSLAFIQSNWLIREKKFKQAGIRDLTSNYSSKFFNIGLGLFTNGMKYGITISHIFYQVVTIAANFLTLRKSISPKILVTGGVLKVIRKFKNYPLYVLPSSLSNIFVSQISIIQLSAHFGAAQLGFLSFAMSLVDVPIKVLGENVVGQVLLQKTAEMKRAGIGQELYDTFKKSYITLTILSILIFSIIIFFGETIFEIVFGDQWSFAGKIASILSISYFFRLINTPSTSIMRIFEREQILVIHTFATAVVILIGLLFSAKSDNLLTYVWIYSLGTSLISICFSSYFLFLLRKKVKEKA